MRPKKDVTQMLFQEALRLHQSGDLIHARPFYEKVLSLDGRHADSLHLLGVLQAQLGNYSVAENLLRRAVAVNAKSHRACFDLGNVLAATHQHEAALKYFDRAAAIKPDDADIQNNRGVMLLALLKPEAAIQCFGRAVALRPSFAAAHGNRGDAHRQLGRYREAVDDYHRALEIDPKFAAACVNLGGTLTAISRYKEAAEYCRHAVSLQPNLPEGWFNLGAALAGLEDYPAAAKCYERCFGIDNDFKFALGALVYFRMKVCDWHELTRNISLLTDKITQKKNVAQPFHLLGLIPSAEVQRMAAELYASTDHPPRPLLGSIPRHKRREKIRIGYYSADFRNHAVSFLMAEVFELHDRDRFELFGFAYGAESSDEMRQRVGAAFDRFIDVRERNDREVAELSRKLEIDIAVDLGGYTENCRPDIFAMRAAPLQVSYIGYLGTMGAPYIDYLIADDTIVPREMQLHYWEKIAYLPSYQANDSKRRISERVFSREEVGLPASGFVFCCFNNNYKITPEVFDCWMGILREAEGSVLLLYAENQWGSQNLRQEAARREINPDRIIFGSRLPREEYLARYRVADLFLDTFPYNAGTTASDALWTGLPVLTLMGESFASRVAASLLNAVGLPELVTTSLDEYRVRAIELARDPAKLQGITRRLADNKATTALFDTPRFTRTLEAAYQRMYERYQAALPADHIRST